jgi:hypothetical protein
VILTRLGWDHDRIEAYKVARTGHHEGSYEGALYTRSGVHLQAVEITSGQEDVTGSLGRRCRAFLKNEGTLKTVSQEQLLKAALAVWETTYVPDYGLEKVPVHWGPIMQADPGGSVIGITARGVGDLAQNNPLEAKSLRKGHLVTSAIRTVLHDWAGMRLASLDIPDLNHTLPADRTYPRGDRHTFWAIAVSLAESIGYDLIPDGQGHVWMRQLPTESSFDFFDAVTAARNSAVATVLTPPVRTQTIRDADGNNLPNWVQVHGFQPPKKGPGSGQQAIDGEWFADPAAIISKENLALNNGERVVLHGILHEYSNPHIKTTANADARAEQIGKGFEQVSQSVTFDSRILPFFDFNDYVSAHTQGFLSSFNLRDFSFSFGGKDDDNVMSVGETRPLSLAGTKIRPAR